MSDKRSLTFEDVSNLTKRGNCRDCGNPWWFDKGNSWVCSTCRKTHGKDTSEMMTPEKRSASERLKEIEHDWINKDPTKIYESGKWLIARVKRLEAALLDLKHHNNHLIEEEMWRIDKALSEDIESEGRVAGKTSNGAERT